MYTKTVAFLAIACLFSIQTEAQVLAYPAVYSAYSPYVGYYGAYAAAYPAFYGWGSNKGGAQPSGSAPPSQGAKLTNNQ